VAMAAINKDGTMEILNQRFRDVVGYTIEDMPDLDHWFKHAFPDKKYRDEVVKVWNQKRKLSGKAERGSMEALVVCKDGSKRYFEFLLEYLGNVDVVAMVDYTERKQAAEQLQIAIQETEKALRETKEKEQEIAHINKVVQIVNSTLDFDDVMTSMMGALQEIFEFDILSIQLMDKQQQTLNLYNIYGEPITEEHIQQWKNINISFKEKGSLSTYVAKTNQPFYFSGIEDDSLLLPTDKQIYKILPFVSVLMLPLELQNETIGCVIFIASIPFDAKDNW